MKNTGRRMMAVSLAAAMAFSAAGGMTAGAEETAETVFAEAPEGWTEADATEELNVHLNAACYQMDGYAAAGNDATSVMTDLVADALITRDENTGEYIPWLAKEYSWSEDGLELSFTLQEGAYFTNGEECKASDVAFSINRVKDDTEHCPDANAKPLRNYVESVEVTGDYTGVIHYQTPNPEGTYFLSTFPIWSEKAYNEMGYDEFFQAPVGTGAYVLSDFDSANAKGIFTMREDEHGYWGYDYLNTYSNIKKITVLNSSEATTRLSSLRTGEADFVSAVPALDVEALKAEGLEVDVRPATTYIFLQFACAEDNIFYEKELREAVSLCIDREAIVASLLGGYGIAAQTDALDTDLGYQTDVTYQYDPDKAAELVAASGYNGEAIRFIYAPGQIDIATELAQAVQSMMQAVGFNVEVVPLETAVYDDSRDARDFDICIASIMKSGNMWYKTANEVIGSDRFNTGHTNEELKELGTSLGTMTSQEKLDETLKEMSEIVLTEFEPNVYLYYPTLLFARTPKLTDIAWRSEHRPNFTFAKLSVE